MGLQDPCLLACVFFLLLLLPVFYLSFFNRATGDDYGYGTYTRAAFQATHSLIPLLAAVGKTVKQYYLSWQGTWFSVAVFSLQPEVFHYIDGDSTVFEKALLERLAAEGQLMAYHHEGFWQCMDTQRDHPLLEKLWASGEAPWKVWAD